MCSGFSHGQKYDYRLWRMKEELSAFAANKEISNLPHEDDLPALDYRGFLLMKLPLEIRFMIYNEHFCQIGEPIGKERVYPARPVCRLLVVNQGVPVRKLFLVSKFVYQETMPLYFRAKHFQFSSPRSLAKFLDIIGIYQRQHITTITLPLNESFVKQASTKLYQYPALANLALTVPDIISATPDRQSRKSPG